MDKSLLPVWGIMPEVIGAVRRNKNIVLTAPTGSGKTTQVPQALLDSGLIKGVILVVQPRRIACRSVGRRVAEERHTPIGGEVGYIVRYDGKSSANTKILFITDGVMLRFLESDPLLSWVGAVIFDEFHERRAMSDVALGLLKQAQKRRPSLRLLVMSATIESDLVANYLEAEVFQSQGRTYHVDMRHLESKGYAHAVRLIPQAVKDLLLEMPHGGDILVFLSGKEDIKQAHKTLSAVLGNEVLILQLHSQLAKRLQDEIFKPATKRKIVLSTNIAETSVTIPGIRAVIDVGFENRVAFDTDLGINRLQLTKITRSSAAQRAGRAGREAPGICVRLWSTEDHSQMVENPLAEIQRTDISPIVMSLKSIGVHDVKSFDFLDPPQPERCQAAEEFLTQIGALGQDGHLTKIGWKMLRLPLPPRYARMVVEAEGCDCVRDVAIVAAIMSGQPIFNWRPSSEEMSEQDARHVFAKNDMSDFFTLVKMFHLARQHRWSAQWCNEHGVNMDAFQEATMLYRKVVIISMKRGAKLFSRDIKPHTMQRCFVTGLLDRVAIRNGDGTYLMTNRLKGSPDMTSIVTGHMVTAANVHILGPKKQKAENADVRLGFLTRVDYGLLQQVAPHLCSKAQVPLELNKPNETVLVREERRYLELPIETTEHEVDIPAAIKAINSQRERAERSGWKRVTVEYGIAKKGVVKLNGERINVNAERTGLHWAQVSAKHPKVVLMEPIVQLPGMDEIGEEAISPILKRKISNTSSALSKLLNN